jgi:precorrin-6Y C5,15-methyltransferase (decarboxylating)
MAKACQYLGPGGVMVLNSVTDESHRMFDEACTALGLTRHSPLHIALNNYNPINILKCEQPL